MAARRQNSECIILISRLIRIFINNFMRIICSEKKSQSHVRNPAHSYLWPPLDRAFHAVTFLPFLEIRYVLSFILREKQALNENKS